MKKRESIHEWLPLAKVAERSGELPTGEAFRTEWIDFSRGIRVGNLEPYERITQILKVHLEGRYGTPFVTDRWGRGEYWQWICWLPRANREAKPVSSGVNFGCAKLFISSDREKRVFQSGLQVERGYAEGAAPYPGCRLKPDWDWHRLLKQCGAGTDLDRELHRLLGREGFVAEAGDWEANAVFTKKNFRSARQIREALKRCPAREWAGFQLYYPMPEKELREMTGHDFVRAVCAAFDEVVPAMNACMQVPLSRAPAAPCRAVRPDARPGSRRCRLPMEEAP
jgi:hypothetical protein